MAAQQIAQLQYAVAELEAENAALRAELAAAYETAETTARRQLARIEELMAQLAEQSQRAGKYAAEARRQMNHVAVLDAQLAAAQKDAERYRWLRNPTQDVALVIDKVTGEVPADEFGCGGYRTYEYRAGDELDAAIDAALEQENEQ